MRIERNHELPRLNAFPHAAIDAVFGTNHPTQIQVHALARASLRRPRKQEANTNASFQFASWIELLVAEAEERGSKLLEGVGDVIVCGR